VAAARGLSNVDEMGTVTRSTPGEQVDVSVRYSNPTQQVCASARAAPSADPASTRTKTNCGPESSSLPAPARHIHEAKRRLALILGVVHEHGSGLTTRALHGVARRQRSYTLTDILRRRAEAGFIRPLGFTKVLAETARTRSHLTSRSRVPLARSARRGESVLHQRPP